MVLNICSNINWGTDVMNKNNDVATPRYAKYIGQFMLKEAH